MVGHFIHSLKDCIWPDFICHFHLFNGRYNGFKHFDSQWHADENIDAVAARSPVAVRINTSFLSKSAASDASSAKELGKFGLVPIASMQFNDSNSAEASCSSDVHDVDHIPTANPVPSLDINCSSPLLETVTEISEQFITIGKFKFPIDVPYPIVPQCFLNSAFRNAPIHHTWPPVLSKSLQADLSQSGYDNLELLNLIKYWGTLCAKCLQWGHARVNC